VHAIHSKEPGETSLGIVGPLLRALDVYAEFCSAKPLVVAGDFNNHVRWDKPGKLNNHANVVARLDEFGSVSAYHKFRGIAQGGENEPTFYHHKSLAKPYHIDYCFVPKSWAITDCAVGTAGEWLRLSDHMPIVVDAAIA
jgi:endonuclease/exonuclease/phosphatase family metal-dependent hydrolase